ncbi:MAG TPA: leucine--tRNA ligase [Anaerolineae bacterium]|nr:leucine--tRNA ligase [Anaerolineae bacterium]
MSAVTEYDAHAIEAKWRKRWTEAELYRVDLDRAERPFYNLMEFPYPSGEGLHVGHFYTYSGADTYGRYQRMQGGAVFQPMGFDAFGIHGENYALKIGENPASVMPRNVARFREEQIKPMGAAFDWSREVNTTDPRYYKWTQWIFIQLYTAGLAYRATGRVNWCPKDLTVLADEQVINGCCERCGTPVVKRELEQWFFRITQYAEQLLDHSQASFTEITQTLQRNWIGRSEGAEVSFAVGSEQLSVKGDAGSPVAASLFTDHSLTIYTTRPDTLWGATFMVLAPEHPLIPQLTTPDRKAEVEAYIETAARKSEIEREDVAREKTGAFTGAYAVNPVNDERIPIWVADYVLMTYGTGAIMAVPAHDQRDFEFARKYNLPLRIVIQPPERELDPDMLTEAWPHDGRMIHSGPLDGTPADQAVPKTIAWLEAQGIGQRAVRYRLRDWLISRQRYWGPPIPMIYCAKDGWQPAPEDQLPVRLPLTENFRPTGTGQSPLASIPEFVNTTCPVCGGAARRETDVSDNFLDSAWYFLRYLSTEFDDRAWDADRVKRWLPVDHYMGGIEHSTLHHLYARFLWKALVDLGHLPREVGAEPFKQLRLHGWITRDGAKMSKSRGNVVNPDAYVQEYGADVTRGHVLFMGSYTEGGDWRDSTITGVVRFYKRVWEWVTNPSAVNSEQLAVDEDKVRRALHKAIKKVSEDIPALGFNTAIAVLMEALSVLRQCRLSAAVHNAIARSYVLLLAPFAPFLAEELWERLGGPFSVHQQPWPVFDPALVVEATIVIPIQVNGKLRDRIEVAAGASEAEVTQQALATPGVQRHTEGKQIVKTVYAIGRLLNIVVK